MVQGCQCAPLPGWGSRMPRHPGGKGLGVSPPSRLLQSPGWPTLRAPVAKPRVSLARDVQGQGPCSRGMLGVRQVSEAFPSPWQGVTPLSPAAIRSVTMLRNLCLKK